MEKKKKKKGMEDCSSSVCLSVVPPLSSALLSSALSATKQSVNRHISGRLSRWVSPPPDVSFRKQRVACVCVYCRCRMYIKWSSGFCAVLRVGWGAASVCVGERVCV